VSKDKLSPQQRKALAALLPNRVNGASSYTLGVSLATMYALERRRLVAAKNNPGSLIWPQTSITWRITDAGRAVLEDTP
jgi:hypothetical protein